MMNCNDFTPLAVRHAPRTGTSPQVQTYRSNYPCKEVPASLDL